jgi:flagellar hook-basal body complex protein FliE
MQIFGENPLPLPERGLTKIRNRSLNGLSSVKDDSSPAGFADTAKKIFKEVDTMQKDADLKIEKFATGEITDIHEVTIAAEQARLAFSLLLQVRNKILEAYQEIMRTQV